MPYQNTYKLLSLFSMRNKLVPTHAALLSLCHILGLPLIRIEPSALSASRVILPMRRLHYRGLPRTFLRAVDVPNDVAYAGTL